MAIDFALSDGVAVVTINRPERLNALDAEHYSALSQAWTKVRDNPDIRVAVVTGAGEKSFTVGADLKSFLTAPPGSLKCGSLSATSCSTAAWRFGSR